MTNEQETMINNGPTRETIKPLITKKRVGIALGVVAVGVGAYYLGPKIVNKVQYLRALKVLPKVA